MLIEKTIHVNKTVPEIFNTLYEKNENIFNGHMQIIRWEKDDWKIKKKIKQRKEFVYLYIENLPDEVVKYTKENDKYLHLQSKNQLLVDTPKCQKIKTKFKILNVNPFLKTVLNELHIVNMKNVIELTQVDDRSTSVKIAIKVQLKIPKTKAVDAFITSLSNNLIDSAIASLNTSQ